MKIKIGLTFFIPLIFSFSIFAQSNSKIEQDLVSAIKTVQKYSDYGSSYDEEKLSNANKVFEENLLKYSKTAATLRYKFPVLSKEISIVSSEDGKFRVYSWDSETGGTMHDYSRVYQYQDADGKVYSTTDQKSSDDDGSGSFVYDIFTVDSKDGKVYVACSTFIGSTNDHYDSADLFKIEGASLNDKVKLIKTNSGMTNTLNFEYNFFSVADRPERPLKLIKFDAATQTIKIPIVINDKEFPNGKVTGKFINYRFNGTNFVKVS